MNSFVIGTDFSPMSTLALRAGLEWSDKLQRKPLLLHVDDLTSKLYSMSALYSLESSLPRVYDFNQWMRKGLDQELAKQLKEVGLSKGDVDIVYEEGPKVEKILEFLQKSRASLLFLGARGHDLMDRLFMGSTTEKISQISPNPLVICRDNGVIHPKKIIFPVDFSPLGLKALGWVQKMAMAFKAEVLLLHCVTTEIERNFLVNSPEVIPATTMQGFFEEKMAAANRKIQDLKSVLSKQNISCQTQVIYTGPGEISQEILKEVRNIDSDLVVLAPHSKNPVKRFFLGSVATSLLRQCPKSLFLYHEI